MGWERNVGTIIVHNVALSLEFLHRYLGILGEEENVPVFVSHLDARRCPE